MPATLVPIAQRRMRHRLSGVIIAALVAWVVIALRDVALPWLLSGEDPTLAFRVYLFAGLPIALLVCLPLGLIAFEVLERSGLRAWHHSMLAGALAGVVVTTVAALTLYPEPARLFWLTPFDIAAGALAGLTGWLVAGRIVANPRSRA